MTQEQKKLASAISSKFISYRKAMINVWRDYLFIQVLVDDFTKKQVKTRNLEIENHNNNGSKKFFAKDIDGICIRLRNSTNSKKALINSVALTESFLQDLTQMIYKEYPNKLNSKEGVEVIGQQIKLTQLIFESQTKEEMIDKMIEEKVRGIFYGNPVDFFEKDKAKIGLDTMFKTSFSKAISKYSEVVNRRNIIIHNESKVDRKYIRETKSALRLGSKPAIDKIYLKNSINLLIGLSAASVVAVLKTQGATKFHKFLLSAEKRFCDDYR